MSWISPFVYCSPMIVYCSPMKIHQMLLLPLTTRCHLPSKIPVQALVSSPNCDAPSPYTCLQNEDFGQDDPDKYNIDLRLKVLDSESNAEAYSNARNKWMRIVTGDLSSKTLPDDGCAQGEAVDDLLICGEDLEVDGVGGVLGMSVRQIYMARSHYHTLVSRNFL